MKARVLNRQGQHQEEEADETLRPRRLADYVGQDAVRAQLSVMLEAAKERGETLEHILLAGPPGLGKTTLAHIISNELGTGLRVTSGPAIEHPGALAAILTTLQNGDVLFIDEIHRLSHVVEESLYPAMEDYCLDVVFGGRALRIPLRHFTIIGATTRLGQLTKPLRDRFGASWRLDLYSQAEVEAIVTRSARILKVEVDEQAIGEIARRSRGTPRIANRLLRRVRDYAQVRARQAANLAVTEQALDLLEIDAHGLDGMDRRIIDILVNRYQGRAVGLGALAQAIDEDVATLEDVYEPYLVNQGFVVRTPKGRIAGPEAYRKLGLRPPKEGKAQGTLFPD